LTPGEETEPGESAANNRLHAMLLIRRGRPEDRPQAIALFEPLVQDPRTSQPTDHLLLAQLYEAEGKLSEARQQLHELVSSQTDPPATQLAIYVDFLLRNKMTEGAAETWLKKLEQADPENWISAALRARWLHSQQRDAEIEPLVEQAAHRGM